MKWVITASLILAIPYHKINKLKSYENFFHKIATETEHFSSFFLYQENFKSVGTLHKLYLLQQNINILKHYLKFFKYRHLFATYGGFYACGLRRDDVVYVPLPIYHTTGGLLGTGMALLFGCTVVLRKKFSVSNFWTDCIKHQCTVLR